MREKLLALLREEYPDIDFEESDELGAGMVDCGPRQNMLRYLDDEGVEMHRGVKFKEIVYILSRVQFISIF